jgi:CDP-glucose 4,6-dehydratase
MEGLEMNLGFWDGKSVFVTGHTGFKGSWLCIWLESLGAKITGYSLGPPTAQSLYDEANISNMVNAIAGDVKDLQKMRSALVASKAEIVFHMAAQSLVRKSYTDPVGTYATNVMGTVNLLEAVRSVDSVRSVVVVSSDKCYENNESYWGYREHDPMGGHDPYSNSKGCTELVTSAYRNSFFAANGSPLVASGRAGNVIGGGDWAEDRLVPDIINALSSDDELLIRNPESVRPWQHVLEPIRGYMLIAEHLYNGEGHIARGWNFGPDIADVQPVSWIANQLVDLWGTKKSWSGPTAEQPHEAKLLSLDITLARARLGWKPIYSLQKALQTIVDWNKSRISGESVIKVTRQQISEYQSAL